MTASFSKTPILFAALLTVVTVATPVFAGDWRTIPGGVGTDGVCTLYNQNLEGMDAARTFLASSGDDGTIRMRVVNVSPNDVLNIRGYPSSESRIIGMIPPNTGGVEYVGKQVGSWVLVRFDNIEGWVHTGFLVPEPGAWRDGGNVETSYS